MTGEELNFMVDVKEFFRQYAPWVNGGLTVLDADSSNTILSNLENINISAVIKLPFSSIAFTPVMFSVPPIIENGKKLIPMRNYIIGSKTITVPHFIFTDVDFQSEPLLALYPNPLNDDENDFMPIILYFVNYQDKPYFVVVYSSIEDNETNIADDEKMTIKIITLPAESIRDFYFDMIPLGIDYNSIDSLTGTFMKGMVSMKQIAYDIMKKSLCESDPEFSICKYNNESEITQDSINSKDNLELTRSLIEIDGKLYYMIKVLSKTLPLSVTVYLKPPFTYSSIEEYFNEETFYTYLMGLIGYSLFEQQYDLNIDLNGLLQHPPDVRVIINTIEQNVYVDLGGVKTVSIHSQRVFNKNLKAGERATEIALEFLTLGKYFGIPSNNLYSFTPYSIMTLIKHTSISGVFE